MFQHPREAQRALQDRVVLAMMQGGWKMGWRFGLVTGVFLSVAQSLTVIRISINTLDYAAGGLAMGAVYKFNMGPRGMAGAIYGLGSGLIVSWIQLVSRTGGTGSSSPSSRRSMSRKRPRRLSRLGS